VRTMAETAGLHANTRAFVPDAREIRWAALGDSFTAGTEPGELTWTTMIESELAGTHPVRLENFARAGATVEDLGREQLPPAVASEPDVVTLICGGNDVIGRVRPSLDRLEHDLNQIWAALRIGLPDAELITATYPAVAPITLRERTRLRIVSGLVELNGIVRTAASRHGVRCVEFAQHPGRARRANYAADGLHPSPLGHRAAAAVLGPALESLIDARQRQEKES
jgi:lysophospholipase L1-like esterase